MLTFYLYIFLFHYPTAPSLWKFRNGVVHGHNVEEEEKKKRESLHTKVTNAYMAYNANKFIVSRHLSTMFDKPLPCILKSDTDYLQCWLHSYDEAIKTQQEFRRRQSDATKIFFKPRKRESLNHSNTPLQSQTDSPHNFSNSPLDDLESINSLASTISYSLSMSQDSFCTSNTTDTDTLDGTLRSADCPTNTEATSVSDSLRSLHHHELSKDDSSSNSVFYPVFS